MSSNDADCALNSDKMSVTISNVNPIEDPTDILIISAIQVSSTLSTVIKNEFCVDARDASISMALIQNSNMKACSLTNDYGLYSIPYNYVYDEIKLDPTMNTQCTIYFDNVETNNALVSDHYIDDDSFTNHLNFISFETNRRTSLYPDALCTNKGGALAASQSTAYGNYIVNDVLCSDPHYEYCISCQFSKIDSFSVTASDASPPSSIPLIGLCFYGMRYLCNDVQISGDEYTCNDASWSIELEIASAYTYCNWHSKYLHLFVSPDAFDISEINVQFMDGTAIQKTDICRMYTPDNIDMISFTDSATYSDTDCVAPLPSISDFIFTADTISTRAMSVDTATASVLDTCKIPVSFGLNAYNSYLTFILRLCYEGHSYECVTSSLNDPSPLLCTIDSWDASLDSSVNQCTDSYNWILLECTEPSGCGSTLRIGHENNINVQINFNDGTTIYSETFCRDSDDIWSWLGPCSTWTIGTETNQYYNVKHISGGNALLYVDEDIDDAFFIKSPKQAYYQRPYSDNYTLSVGDVIHVDGDGFDPDETAYSVSFWIDTFRAFHFAPRHEAGYVIRNTYDGSWGVSEQAGGMLLSTDSNDAISLEFKLTDTQWEVTSMGNRIPIYDFTHRLTGDITTISTAFIDNPTISVTTPGYDMKQIKSFGFYISNIEVEDDIQLAYALCHDGIRYECSNAELSVEDDGMESHVMCDINEWSVNKDESSNGCIYQTVSEDYLHLTVTPNTATLPFKFAVEYMLFEYTDGTHKQLSSFCFDSAHNAGDPVSINNYVIVEEGYPSCEDMYCVEGYSLRMMHADCDSLKDCIGFGFSKQSGWTYPAGEINAEDYQSSAHFAAIGDGCFKQNGFCESEYAGVPTDIIFRQKITSDMAIFDTYDDYAEDPYELYSNDIVPYNVSDRMCAKWISSAERDAWDVFPIGNTMQSAANPNHYDEFQTDYVFYLDSEEVDEILVTYQEAKQFDEPLRFGFTIDVNGGNSQNGDEFIVRLCVYDASSDCFVSYECIVMPLQSDLEYFCGRGSWTINLNDENCEGYEEYSTIFIKSVKDSSIQAVDILDASIYYRDGSVLTHTTFCVDDTVEGRTQHTNDECNEWYYGARNGMWEEIRLQDKHQSIFYMNRDRTHGLVAFDYLSTEDLLEPDRFGILIGDEPSADSAQLFDFAMCWKGVEFLCIDIEPNVVSTWVWCNATAWDIRFDTDACLSDTHHDSIRIFNNDWIGTSNSDSLAIQSVKVVMMDDNYVQRDSFCIQDATKIKHDDCDAPGSGSFPTCSQWKAGFNPDGGGYEYNCFKLHWHYEVVLYFSQHEGYDSALAASHYTPSSDLVQPIKFGFKVSGDSSVNTFVVRMCYERNLFVCSAGVVPNSVGEWEYCEIADYELGDSSDCDSSNYDYILIEAKCLVTSPDSIVCDSLAIAAIRVLFNDGSWLRKDTFCIKRDDEEPNHQQGALANGASCLSLGFGNVYTNMIISYPPLTYLYWEHVDDTQPLLVTSVLQSGAELQEIFMDVTIAHHANGNYAKLVPADPSFTTSWEEANQYCQAYGYLGLATVLSAELNTEAASLCGSGECWIGAYLLHGLCDADDTDLIKCWKWIASYNAAFVYSNFDDSDNDDLDNFNSHQFVYTYLDTADANEWRTVDDKTVERAYGVLCDITLKSTQINDQWSSVTCNNDASKALFAGLFNINEDVLTNLDDAINEVTATQRIQQHIMCTEGVYRLLLQMNFVLRTPIDNANRQIDQINLVLDGIGALADVLDIDGLSDAITAVIRTINDGVEIVVEAIMRHDYEFGQDDIVDLTDFYYDLIKYLSKALCDELIPDIEGKLEAIKEAVFTDDGSGVLNELKDSIEESLGIDGSTVDSKFEHVTIAEDQHLDFTVAINIGVIICYDQMMWYLCIKKSYNVAVDLHGNSRIYEARSLYFEGPYGKADDIEFSLGFSLPINAFVEYDFIPRIESISESPNFFELGIAVNWPATYVDEIMDKALPIIGRDDLQFGFLPPFLNEMISGGANASTTWSIGLIGDFSQNLLSLHCGGFRLSLGIGHNKKKKQDFAVHLSANVRAKYGSMDYGTNWMDDIELGDFGGVTDRLLDGFNLIGDMLEGPLKDLQNKIESFAEEIVTKLKNGAIDAINEIINGLNDAMCAIVDLINIIFEALQAAEDEIKDAKRDCRSRLRSVGMQAICNGFFDPIIFLIPNVNEIPCSPVIDTIRRRQMGARDNSERKINMHVFHQIKVMSHHIKKIHSNMHMNHGGQMEDDEEDNVAVAIDEEDVVTTIAHAADDDDDYGEAVPKPNRMSSSAILVLSIALFFGSFIGFFIGNNAIIMYSKKRQKV